MKYGQLVMQVAHSAGFSSKEAETALQLFTGTLAARLDAVERKLFASQLPKKLQVMTTDMPPEAIEISMQDIYETFSELENIDINHARKQVVAAWRALKLALDPKVVRHIRSLLPQEMVAELR